MLIRFNMHVIYISMRMFPRGSVSRKVDWWPMTLQYGIRAIVSMLSLDGPDKWSLNPRFREEIVSRGLISDLRMFLSVNELLASVIKLEWSSGEIKPHPVCYLTIEREGAQHLGC